MEKVRSSNIELFRIVCMLLIICFHFSDHSVFNLSELPITIDWIVMDFARVGGAIGNCAFVLITGYFMYNKTITKERLFKTWFQIFVYSMGCGLIAYYYLGIGDLSFGRLFAMATPVIHSRYWFMSAFFITMLLSPYFNIMIAHMTKKDHKNMLIIYFALLSLIPCIIRDAGWFYASPIIGFFLFYFIGAYIGKYNIIGFKKNIYNLFSAILCIATMWMSSLIIKIYIPGENLFHFIWDQRLPLPILSAVFLFIFFKNISIPYNKVINILASTVFGCYLLHMGDLWSIFFRKIFNPEWSYGSGLLIIHMIVSAFFILGICAIIDILIKKIICNTEEYFVKTKVK